MSYSMRKACVFAVVAVCGLMTAGCFGIGMPEARFKATKTVTAPHEASAAVRVASQNGRITVCKGDVTEAKIVAQFACISEERLAGAQVVAEKKDGVLVIEAKFPGGRPENNESCSFDITLPGAIGVDLETANGGIKVTGLGGAAKLKTSNGGIKVDGHNGTAVARTNNGGIEISAVTSDIVAASSNGSVNVSGAKGTVEATTSNGGVTVKLADDNRGPAKVRSNNGAVKLVVGKAFAGRINYSTSIGSVSVKGLANVKQSEIKENSGSLLIGDGDGVSEVHTNIGAVEVRGAE